MILLTDYNSYLKKLHDSHHAMDYIHALFIEEDVFSLEDTNFEVMKFTKSKARDIEGCQVEILKF